MNYQLDITTLAGMVRAKRAGRPLRALVKEIGAISPATLSRVEHEKAPHLSVLLLLCNWLEMSPALVLHDLHHVGPASAEHEPSAADLTELELFVGLTPTVSFMRPSGDELMLAFCEAKAKAEAQIASLLGSIDF